MKIIKKISFAAVIAAFFALALSLCFETKAFAANSTYCNKCCDYSITKITDFDGLKNAASSTAANTIYELHEDITADSVTDSIIFHSVAGVLDLNGHNIDITSDKATLFDLNGTSLIVINSNPALGGTITFNTAYKDGSSNVFKIANTSDTLALYNITVQFNTNASYSMNDSSHPADTIYMSQGKLRLFSCTLNNSSAYGTVVNATDAKDNENSIIIADTKFTSTSNPGSLAALSVNSQTLSPYIITSCNISGKDNNTLAYVDSSNKSLKGFITEKTFSSIFSYSDSSTPFAFDSYDNIPDGSKFYSQLVIKAHEKCSVGVNAVCIPSCHITVCPECNAYVGVTAHHFETIKTAKAATCKDEGNTAGLACTDCGYVIEPVQTIAKLTTHTPSKTITNASKATYTKTGYSGDTLCTVCGMILAKGMTLDKLQLGKPTAKVKVYKKKAAVTFKKVTNATSYQVSYKLKTKKKWKTKTLKTSKLTLKKLKSKKKYQFKVRAVITDADGTAYSKYSKTITKKIK